MNTALLKYCIVSWKLAGSVGIFWAFEAVRPVWTAVLEINDVICRPDSRCPIAPCFNNGNVEWIVSAGAVRYTSHASLSFFPHKQPAPDLFLHVFYPTDCNAACPLTFVLLLSLFTLSCFTTVSPSFSLFSLPGGIYQAARTGGLQHRLCQPTLWTWDQEEEGEKALQSVAAHVNTARAALRAKVTQDV